MLGRPDAIETHRFGEHRLFDTIVQELMLPLGCRMRQLDFEPHRELHPRNLALPTLPTHNHPALRFCW